MMDRSLSVLLMAFFGISGTGILILGWVEPMPALDRVLATLTGAGGLLFALSRALIFRSARRVNSGAKVAVELEVENTT